MPLPHLTITITPTVGGKAGSAINCRLGSNPVRTAGLGGDELVVFVAAADWPLPDGPVGVSLDGPVTLRFGLSDGDPVVLEHYYLRQVDAVTMGSADLEGSFGSVDFREVRLRLMTLPGILRDGRGALLRETTFNPLLSSGEVDEGSDQFMPNSVLVSLCLDALGFNTGMIPVALDDLPPPGPLDWGNASAIAELEALLGRIGWEVALPNSGSAWSLYKLPRAGQGVTLDGGLDEIVDSSSLARHPAIRGSTVIVTSGTTRTTVLTKRDLGELEFVYYDETAHAWKNDAGTPPGEIKPGDIDAFRAGPDPADAQKRAQYGRLLRAVRSTREEDKGLRLVEAWEPMRFNEDEGVPFLSSNAAVAVGFACAPAGVGDLLVPAPMHDADAAVRFGPCQVHALAGVFVLPEEFVYARPASVTDAKAFTRSEMAALSGGDLTVYFAHEARYGYYKWDYFVIGFVGAVDGGGEVTVAQLADEALSEALDDPLTVKVHFPRLRRIAVQDPNPLVNPVFLNDDLLSDIAQKIAEARIAGGAVLAGTVVLRGLIDVAPGSCGGACGRVEWDVRGLKTILTINEHETPDGEMDLRASEANRSLATGVSRWASGVPGSAVALADIKAALTPGSPGSGGSGGGGSGGGGPETASGTRGHEARHPASAGAEVVGALSVAPVSEFFARITGTAGVGSNRWSYTWVQAAPEPSTGLWRDAAGGFTSGDYGSAYNLAECMNDGAGVEGNGVDRANLPGGWAMKPIPIGSVVKVLLAVSAGAAGVKACWFSQVNLDDGQCVAPGSGGGGGSLLLAPSDGNPVMLEQLVFDEDGRVVVDESWRPVLLGVAYDGTLSDSDVSALRGIVLDEDRRVVFDESARTVVMRGSPEFGGSGGSGGGVVSDESAAVVASMVIDEGGEVVLNQNRNPVYLEAVL